MAILRYVDTKKRDPFRNFNFRILLGGVEVAACRKVSGLTASVEVVKFRAGSNRSSNDELLPGRVAYEAITMEAGLTNDKAFKDWASALVRHGASKKGRDAEPGFRREIQILVYDIDNDISRPVKKFTVHQAWVSKFTALSELAADANETLIETIEIQNEGFTEEAVPAA
jgi:phage tail-like protein